MIFGLWGDDKTCKTTLALTFPKPLAYMEFDIGGFDRASYRFKKDIANGSILTKYTDHTQKERQLRYIVPYQAGAMDLTKLTIRPTKIVTGVKELWYKFLLDYVTLLNNEEISSIAIDTATLLWEVICTGYLQEKQEAQHDPQNRLLPGEKLRVSLLPIEYREPNIRMRGLIYQAKAHGKHLVLTHHSRDEYGPMPTKDGIVEGRTGKRERSGWSPLGDGADVIVHTYLDKGLPWCIVDLAEVLPLVGMKFEEPTYNTIAKVIKMIRGELGE